MPVPALALRTWLRYVVPLTLLAIVALAPIAWLGAQVVPPNDAASARVLIRLGWGMAATAWMFQLWLVSAVAPAVRGVATGEPLSQVRVLGRGLAGLVRGVVPCGLAVIAIAMGLAALVVPGLVLFAMLAMTGAAGDDTDALATSIAVAKAHLRTIAIVAAVVIGADLAIALACHLFVLPAFPKKPTAAQLLPARAMVRAIAAALVVGSPLAASAIASVFVSRRRSS